MSPDPWQELTPGGLARLALDSDPEEIALDLLAWWGDTRNLGVTGMARWFREVSDAIGNPVD